MKNNNNLKSHLRHLFMCSAWLCCLVLPTWILYKIMYLPQGHDWHTKEITLKQWANGATQLTKIYSLFFWIATPCPMVGLIFEAGSVIIFLLIYTGSKSHHLP